MSENTVTRATDLGTTQLEMAKELVMKHLTRIHPEGDSWKKFETKEGLLEAAALIYEVKQVLVHGNKK